jgi:anti-sigma factor RsiW
MTCPNDDILSAYYDGELPTDRASAVELHLRACADCRASLAGMRRVSSVFSSAGRLELSAAARRRIEEALAVPAWVRLVLPVARPFAAAAAVLLAIGLPVLLLTSSSQTAEASVPASWETAVISRDTSDSTAPAQAQFADWVVADLSSSRHR